MKLKAYAKLNLALDITGRRKNGYHELDMVMQSIDLCDDISVDKAKDIRVRCDNVREDQNTAYKAAKLFFDHTRIGDGAAIDIEKHIPQQAGLGGGSSDAAAVLRALNVLYNTDLTDTQQLELAVRIGADVPFFLHGGCARAQGIGEILTPLDNRCNFHYLLVQPAVGVDTAAAYAKYHDMRPSQVDIHSVISALQSGDEDLYFRLAKNALSDAGNTLCPETEDIRARMIRSGAKFAMMTGSGSCVFGVFDQQKLLEKAAGAFDGLFVCIAQNIDMGNAIYNPSIKQL